MLICFINTIATPNSISISQI